MIRKYLTHIFSVFCIVFTLFSGCTNKEINLITNINFDAFVEGKEEGFVKDSLGVTISVMPQRPYPDFYYYAKYEVTQGEGYFVDGGGEVIPENEDRQLLEEEDYTTNWTYIGTSAEEHLIKFYYRDNYEKRKETIHQLLIKNVDILWEATSEVSTATVKDSIPVQLQLQNQTEGRDVDFTYSITLPEGAGELLDADKEPIEKGKPVVIVPGTTPLTFIPLQGGANTLVFDLMDSNGQELQDTLSFEVEGEVINLPPTAVDDTVEVTVGMEEIIEVLINDTDPETDMLMVEEIVIKPNNGTVVVNGDGTITYTPNPALPPGVNDSFTYTIKDNPTGNISENEATVNITFIDRETIPIADANFEQKLIELGFDTDGVVNGVMYKEDAEAIVELTVSGAISSYLNIIDFSGIEYFINLEVLVVSFNTAIDTLELVSNLKLRKLSIAYTSVQNFVQPEFENLKEISIGFGGIEGLDFKIINSLETITLTNTSYRDADFSNLNNLKSIKILNSGNLESLNVEGVSNLDSLEVSTSAISSLDLLDIIDLRILRISQSSNLECIQVKDINEALNNTDWTIEFSPQAYYSLNCSQPRETIAIPDAVFEQALIDGGHDSDGIVNQMMYKTDALAIKDLEIIDNSRDSMKISNFKGIESFENMTSFTCSYPFGTSNEITSFDLQMNTKLKKLNLAWVNLPSAFSLKQLVALEEVFLSGINGFPEINDEISVLSSLKIFTGGFMNLGDLDLRSNILLEEIGIGPGISSINIQGLNGITRIAMSSGVTIPELNLSDAVNLNFLRLSQVSGFTQLDISNNSVLEEFTLVNSEGIECVQVNNIDQANTNTNWNIQPESYYSLDCSQPRETIPFNNPALEQVLIELGHDSTLDNMVYRDKVENLRVLDVSEKGLNSLDGIEVFPMLESLTAKKNNLTSVDLSQNTALTQVILDENQLTSIDLRSNTQLKRLLVWKNVINTIDLSQNSALTYLDLDNNDLATIDVSANSNLDTLDVKNNRLSTINLVNNSKLKFLAAGNRKDITNRNRIASIQLNNLPDLDYLWVELMPEMTSLDVSSNLKLRIMQIPGLSLSSLNVTNNTLLEHLSCGNNNLTNLNVTNNENLKLLNIGGSGNTIPIIDLTNSVNLETFAAYNVGLNSLDVINNSKLKSLAIPKNNVANLNLSNNPLLESLSIAENNFVSIDLTNQNQSVLVKFVADKNSSLSCIAVTDVAIAETAAEWVKDATASYAESCP